MGDGSATPGATASVAIVGLGPSAWSAAPPANRDLLLQPDRVVILRTVRHPAAAELSELRDVVSCDDLYEQSATFEDVYDAIAARVVEAAQTSKVAYAVPGSPLVGEFAVGRILKAIPCELYHAPSFLDAVLVAVAVDPLDRGFQLLDGHNLPTPLALDKPTVIAHVDLPVVLAEVAARLGRVLDEATEVAVLIDLQGPEQAIHRVRLDEVDPGWAGIRTALFVDAIPGGLVGVVRTMVRLRRECPWDRQQTHASLVKNLIEECYELVEAISRLPADEVDWTAYGAVEDELGDVLLQVLFHAVIAGEIFDVDDVAENLRQKLIHRHPHVFAGAVVGSAEEVKANWDRIKAEEKNEEPKSILGQVPAGMPALSRAAKVQRAAAKIGFDWPAAPPVVQKLIEEVRELEQAIDDRVKASEELGDLLFSAVNLARHVKVEPELALRRAIDKFVDRFERMESMGPLEGLTLEEMDQRWETVKTTEASPSSD